MNFYFLVNFIKNSFIVYLEMEEIWVVEVISYIYLPILKQAIQESF